MWHEQGEYKATWSTPRWQRSLVTGSSGERLNLCEKARDLGQLREGWLCLWHPLQTQVRLVSLGVPRVALNKVTFLQLCCFRVNAGGDGELPSVTRWVSFRITQ